jgi:hypothetical protein
MEIIYKEFQGCVWKLLEINLLFVTAYFVSATLST